MPIAFEIAKGARVGWPGSATVGVFDIGMLTDRLIGVIDRLHDQPDLVGLPVGLFGASTGAAPALRTAADPRSDRVAAVVCRGGRPDLGEHHLPAVTAPTLLIVGGADTAVLGLNRTAQADLNRLLVIPGATPPFEEPRALDRVADLAVDWFLRYLVTGVGSRHVGRAPTPERRA